jgi:hypothetical protein
VNAKATLPGVAGTIGLTNGLLLGHLLTVDGRRAKRHRGEYVLPGADGGMVRARLRGRIFSEHPIISVGGHDYTTGDATAPFLRLITFLPLLFLFSGNPVSALMAVLGIVFNLWILRAPRTEAWKAGIILGTFVMLVMFMTFWAFFSSWVISLFRR